LSADRALNPGREHWFGLRFTMDEGWHIYWANPGDSGGPPTAKWSVPAGFDVRAFEWPAPERIGAPPIVNYGYHGEVTLPFRLVVPRDAGSATSVALGADVRYLICKDICVAGRAGLGITLPVTARQSPSAAGRAVIDAARARVPGAAPSHWRATATHSSNRFVLEVDTGRPHPGALFFPLEPGQIDDGALPEVVSTARGVRFTLARSPHLLKLPSALTGVVTLSSGESFVVRALLTSGASR
jgi:thiol:disulfide interchange protein DsbD